MTNYFKYPSVDTEYEKWGLSVLNAGYARIRAAEEYPVKNHPSHHYFKWDDWRTLQEYQVVYILNGQGLFESASVPLTEVKAGTAIVLFPGERHRYKPDSATGWDEYWVGFRGTMIDNLLQGGFLSRETPCFSVGFKPEILDLFNTIIDNIRHERAGYQPLVSGAVMHLIGQCHSAVKQEPAPRRASEIVQRARFIFRANIDKPYTPEQVAQDLNLSYSSFRKMFKSQTGLSPGQYFLQLKINRASKLLNDGTLLVKEISASLNFESAYYFSRVFKEKTGMTPTEYRDMYNTSASCE
ncbi:AraC family transcriptional regulator [Mucilaginibacter pedocola]|uniref:HTH araC/xylS-type domain-containing protein n=1 Tax=Mucilaginibacter pedocola TaxID=1792845 RepID=A0A1S9PCY2_9SPHI|nr:AraC family transcriptional regulator [Mucilaginibacter pedocola]OOQ58781.1 hypothetical protein BC343_09015 [Mucilaginibacter pedocola]